MHNVFHVSMLRKCEPDPSAILRFDDLAIQEDTSYEEAPVQILDRKVVSLRRREISLVKVLWQYHTSDEATWELESVMRQNFPHLFSL